MARCALPIGFGPAADVRELLASYAYIGAEGRGKLIKEARRAVKRYSPKQEWFVDPERFRWEWEGGRATWRNKGLTKAFDD